ncbi:unnamed protein product [Thelazia callipaeda]|uniref:UTP--glucose-1-phosphate uridylyltransferase n=1 Tax=Thelazia callipaeda TaxID=103827 RepID=A0A0N5CKZ1_THECL|nr:unnamed protein product [Thelazia callipaeda]
MVNIMNQLFEQFQFLGATLDLPGTVGSVKERIAKFESLLSDNHDFIRIPDNSLEGQDYETHRVTQQEPVPYHDTPKATSFMVANEASDAKQTGTSFLLFIYD